MPDNLDCRGAGILLPVFSLPSPYGIGTLGKNAYDFIDFLKASGQMYWQVLPVGPTSYGDSPYQSFSAFAGNPYFIDIKLLEEEGLLAKGDAEKYDWGGDANYIDYAKIYESRFKVLGAAFRHGAKSSGYENFCEKNAYWLDDYSFFMALKCYFGGCEWLRWPEDIRRREPAGIHKYMGLLADEIDFWKFCQYKFYEEWYGLKDYANSKGIKIIGDIPIYVALDSADVWCHTDQFQLDADLRPVKVAGVPPDLFSATGQLWGNPIYDWGVMEKDGFSWWKSRMRLSAEIYDVVRIDHFIGIVKYYSIPAGDKTAENGEWVCGPGQKLTDAINSVLGSSSIIAEDLGVAIPEVKKLLKSCGYPGMKIIQNAFDGNPDNDHLPYNFERNMVVYGGTHDNETLAGAFNRKSGKELKLVFDYLNVSSEKDIPWAVIRTANGSVANTVIFQMQDILELPNTARINIPSTIGKNWRWRMTGGELTPELSKKLYELEKTYGRLPRHGRAAVK